MYVDAGDENGLYYWEYFWSYPNAYYYDVLSAPSVDASPYASSDYSVWLDFDFFFSLTNLTLGMERHSAGIWKAGDGKF
ncbi:MAG: hypothetical protein ACHP78_19975 [Terriglobales bacterium]